MKRFRWLASFVMPSVAVASAQLRAAGCRSDGPNLLLFRPTNGPVFSISPACEVRVHKLKVEADYRLYTLNAAQSSWIVEFLHDVRHSMAQGFSTYAFDPDTGAPQREYLLPANLGWGLACTDGDEFRSLRANEKTRSQAKLEQKTTPGGDGHMFRQFF
jgi:hypothetical protein